MLERENSSGADDDTSDLDLRLRVSSRVGVACDSGEIQQGRWCMGDRAGVISAISAVATRGVSQVLRAAP